MPCYYNCNKHNFVFLTLTILHRKTDGREYIKKHAFCCMSCMNHFKATMTTDENGYTYFNAIEEPTDAELQFCSFALIAAVQKYKAT